MKKRLVEILVGSIVLLILPVAGMTQEQFGGTAQTVGVTTTIEPFMSVTVVTAETERQDTDLPFRNLGSYVDGGSLARGVVEFFASLSEPEANPAQTLSSAELIALLGGVDKKHPAVVRFDGEGGFRLRV